MKDVEEKCEDLQYMTGVLNTMAASDDLDLCYTKHCCERMKERSITTLDIINVLKFGDVVTYQGKAKLPSGYNSKIHKYKVVGKYLGRENSIREIGVIVLIEIDRFKNPTIKIQQLITVMWEDFKK